MLLELLVVIQSLVQSSPWVSVLLSTLVRDSVDFIKLLHLFLNLIDFARLEQVELSLFDDFLESLFTFQISLSQLLSMLACYWEK